MQVTHYFDASLTSPNITTIPAMQGDGIRLVVARLMEGEEPWVVPEGVKAGLSYELPGKEPGYYDRLDDGTSACVIDGNQVSVVLEPVLTERPGPVKMSIILRDPEDTQIATFPFHLWVKRVPGMVHGENLPAPVHKFDGKIYYGGPGGVLQPMGLGEGVRAEQQEDGGFLLVTENGTSSTVEEQDPTVPLWAKQPEKPTYTAEEVGAEADGTAVAAIEDHEANLYAHGGVRRTVQSLTARLEALEGSVPTQVSQLQNDAGYLNQEAVDGQIQTFEQSKDLELITSFKLTEAVSSLVINTDSSGQLFELETAVFELRTGDKGDCGEGNSGAVGIIFQNKKNLTLLYPYSAAGFAYTGTLTGSGAYKNTGITAYATVRNKLGIADMRVGQDSASAVAGQSLRNYVFADSPITKITVNSKLPANAEITVYGVRSENNA